MQQIAHYFGTPINFFLHAIATPAVLSLPVWTGIEFTNVLLGFTTFISVEAILFAIANQYVTNAVVRGEKMDKI